MHNDINIYIRWCRCRYPPWTCKCNYRCLAKRRSLAVRNFLRSEESLNLRWIHAISRLLPKPCLWCVGLKNVRAGAAKVVLQSFDCTASENIQRASGFFKIFFNDGMSCVGIAAAWMNRFKGSLYNFASVTQRFLRQHTFQTSQSNSIRKTVVHKTFNSSSSKMLRLWFLACSPWNYRDSWKAAL